MELKQTFSTSPFGGFRKKEVTAYLAELTGQIDQEIELRQQQIDSLNTQMAGMKDLVDRQYEKIVDLSERLAPFEEAKTEAAELLKHAEADAERRIAEAETQLAELRKQADAILAESVERSKLLLERANEQAERLLAAAGTEAEALRADAKRESEQVTLQARDLLQTAKQTAQTLLTEARRKEQQLWETACNQTEQNISLSEEYKERARRMMEDAQEEADAILRRSQLAAKEKQEYYDEYLRRLEGRRTDVLRSLDEVKEHIRSLSDTKPKPFAEPVGHTLPSAERRGK